MTRTTAELAETGITTAMWVLGGFALLVIVLGVLLVLIRVVSRRNARDYPGSDG